MESTDTTSKRGTGSKQAIGKNKRGGKGKDATAATGDGFTDGSINNNVRQIADKPKRAARAEAQDLPGMTDRKIKPLHDKAKEYVALRDQRMALGAQEVEAKGQLLDLMHAHKKESYICEGIEISIISEQEKIKVKVAKGDDDDDEALMSE